MKRVESPFFGRAYGSYTPSQVESIGRFFGTTLGSSTLLDPFSGLGSALPSLLDAGHNVTAVDLNPVATALLELRDPTHLARVNSVRLAVAAVLSAVPPTKIPQGDFEPGWVPVAVNNWLCAYRDELRRVEDPHVRRVMTLLPLLAARSLTTFTSSDNAAWLRPGGIVSTRDPAEEIRSVFLAWSTYLYREYRASRQGTLTIRNANILSIAGPSADGVLFSPPYANRLDYLRMFAPEAAILKILTGEDALGLSSQLIGTTVVSSAPRETSLGAHLPRSVQSALRQIRNDVAKDSATYYYPFFLNYALQLHEAMTRIIGCLRPGARGIVFLRDTPRKDVLFPSVDIVKSVLRDSGYLVRANAEVVRQHIGMRRKRTHSSLQGLAQREWTVTFEARR